jgi:hypothetical protein
MIEEAFSIETAEVAITKLRIQELGNLGIRE